MPGLAPRGGAPRAGRRPPHAAGPLPLGAGTFTLAGQAAGLLATRRLPVGAGPFALAGLDVALTVRLRVSPILFPRFLFLGRFQQGQEVPLTLQCQTAAGSPDDPLAVPVVSVYRDGAPPVRIETVRLAADLRGVVDGLFRLPLALDHRYATAGRYLLVFRWVDEAGHAHQIPGGFTILPAGTADGTVVALRYVRRPDARYLIWQTDTGRLVRGRNPR